MRIRQYTRSRLQNGVLGTLLSTAHEYENSPVISYLRIFSLRYITTYKCVLYKKNRSKAKSKNASYGLCRDAMKSVEARGSERAFPTTRPEVNEEAMAMTTRDAIRVPEMEKRGRPEFRDGGVFRFSPTMMGRLVLFVFFVSFRFD